MKKILVTGANGQLGKKIVDLLGDKFELVLTDSAEMDITDKTKVFEVIKSEKPDFIIHGAAYTKVDAAEENEDLCRKINSLGTRNVAEAAKEYDSVLFYVSTDYVFNGTGNIPLTENDQPDPLSVYGKTKLEGENFVQEICNKYYILRVAWLFGELPENYPGSNFIETMLRLAKEKDQLTIVNDQIGSPTYTKDLVEIIKKMIENTPEYGLYHFSGQSACSWYDFAKEIFKQSKVYIEVKPITSEEFKQKATRPAYSYLSKDKIEKTLNFKVRPWQEMAKNYLKLK